MEKRRKLTAISQTLSVLPPPQGDGDATGSDRVASGCKRMGWGYSRGATGYDVAANETRQGTMGFDRDPTGMRHVATGMRTDYDNIERH